ncbi:MAG: 4Fe-4S dicluster domain-containing protein [Candidatus Atribacteria bacterium]|nr:4Fe-4S dicluster domain-containing protein [Candidatus Atribacteria bacterium]
MSLFDAAERFAALDHSAVTLDTERCLHSQDKYSTCTACFGLCPVDAITAGKPPALDAEKCQTCLACLTVCPVGAYAADDAVVSLLNAVTHLEGSVLELLCERNPHAALGISELSTGIRVRGCLAGLGCGAYLALAAFGLEHILVRTDACSGCEWGTLPRQVEAQVRQAKQLLEAWGKVETLDCVSELDSPLGRPLWEATNPPLSRRDLFRLAARQGQEAIGRAIENERTKPGHHPGRDRLRLLGAVAHLPASQPGYTGSLRDMDFAWVSVSETCTACGVCARACPTSALQFEKNEDETAYTLTFSARNCVDCEMCLHVCAPSAVSVNHSPTFAQIFNEETVTLQEGGLIKCTRCGALTAAQSGVNLCPLCEYRRTHPFGSMLPPGVHLQLQSKKKNLS